MDASQHPLLHVMTAHKPPSSTDTARTLRVLRQHINTRWEFLRIWEFQSGHQAPQGSKPRRVATHLERSNRHFQVQPRRPLLTFCSPDARRSMPMHNRNDERQQKFDHLPAGLPAQYRRPERTKRQSSPTCTEPRRRNCSITFSAASKLNSSCKSLQQVSCQIKLLYDRSQIARRQPAEARLLDALAMGGHCV